MRSISEETRIIMNTRRNFVNYARVVLHDGTVLNLTPSDFRISGNSFTDDWNEGEAFTIGSVIGKTATLLLDNTDGRVENTFTLQTSEPVDWATNYNDYYIYDGSFYFPLHEEEAPTWEEDTYYTLTNSVTYRHGKFSEYDFYMAYFELKVVLPKSVHYQGELVDTELFIGTFTVTTPASRGATIEITGVDNMHMFDKSFDDCTLNFSSGVNLLTVLNRCCNDCHVAIGYSGFINQDIIVYKKPEGVTYREVVSYIAQIAGCNAKIIPSGALTLTYYDMSPFTEILDGGRFRPWDGVDNVRDTLDGGSFNPWTEGNITDGGGFLDPLGYHNLTATNGTTISTDEIHFTGVMVSYEAEENGNTVTRSVHYPDVQNWDDYAMQIADNPFVYDGNVTRNGVDYFIPDVVANTVWDAIGSLYFRVFNCQSIQDPTIEAGDCALVYDVKGNIYPTIITNVTFKTGGMTDISCTAESPVKQNSRYVNPAAKAVAKADIHREDYNTMVAHFNEIANAALGYHKTTVSGVTYLYSGNDLASSRNVVMITGNGIFISDNYNTPERSWNSGVDITTATMLMNLIYVHGLTADWIVAGDISAERLKANVITSINNSTGSTTIAGGKIATNSITANHIQSNAVTAAKIQSDAITAAKIQAGAVTARKISVDNLAAISANMGTLTAGSITGGTITGTTAIKSYRGNDTNNGYTEISGGDCSIYADANNYFMVKAYGDDWNNRYVTLGPEITVNDDDDDFRSQRNLKYLGWAVEDAYNEHHSDRKLKKKIKDIPTKKSREIILGARPRYYEFKKDLEGGVRSGFIAQELRESLDKIGDTTAIERESIRRKGEREVIYEDFIAHLVNTTKDLYEIVNKQQAEIDELKTRLEKLESIVNTKE